MSARDRDTTAGEPVLVRYFAAAEEAAAQLASTDRVGVVTFADEQSAQASLAEAMRRGLLE